MSTEIPALPASAKTPPVLEPAVEALHLRRLLEQQPACLLRVGIDGLLLAVNEAALRLLGGESLTQVLGSNLTKLIMPRQHEEWQEFAGRVRDGVPGSIECNVTDLSGKVRTILLQAVPLLDHADGVPSMILTARDISAPRRLEASLREHQISRELDDLQKELTEGISGPSHRGEGEIARSVVADDAAERIRETLVKEHQAALILKEQEAQQRLDGVRVQLEHALAEQQRLTTLLDDREIGHQRVVAAHAAERIQLQQKAADEHQLALLLKEREAQQRLESVRNELDQALVEQHRLTTLLDERDLEQQRAVAAHVAERAQLQQTLAEQHQLALLLKEREGRQLLDGLRAELEQALAEQQRVSTEEREGRQLLESTRLELARALAEGQRLTMILGETQVNQQIADEHAAKRAESEQALAAALVRLTQIEKTLADQRVVLKTVDENTRSLERLAATGRVAIAVGRELQTISEAVDARTEFLLASSALDADNRQVIEALRADAIEAASLARQILLPSETPMIADSSTAGTSPSSASDDAGREP